MAALQQTRISDTYPSRKPFSPMSDGASNGGGKRKAADLRVQTLLAQESAKLQCSGGQEQQQQQQADSDGRAATDFTGFFSSLKQQGQQQQQEGVPPPFMQQQDLRQDDQQQQQQHGALTLEQLLDQHDLQSRDRPPEQQLQHMVSLDRMFGADTSRDGFVRGGGAAAAAQDGAPAAGALSGATAAGAGSAGVALARQQAAVTWHLPQLQAVPWDWSVKSSMRLSSPAPLAVLQEAQESGLQGLVHAVAAGGACGRQAAAGLSSQERLAHALMQWQHPAAPLPPSLLAVQAGSAAAAAAAGGPAPELRGSDAAAAAMLQERVEAWRCALRAGYVAVRHGHCPVLYVCGQAFRQSLTAVICAPGVMGSGGAAAADSSEARLTALVSRTSRPLRAHLEAFGAEGVLAGHAEPAAAGDVQLPAGAFDGQPGSQLMLCGAMAVHGLYAALLALPWCGPEQPDVPLLSAPVPFMHAQLCSLRLEVLPDVVLEQQQLATAAAAPADGVLQPLHYAELRAPGGLIMPWTVHRLLRLVADTQGGTLGGFQAYLGTEASSSSLNVLPELWQSAEAAAAEVAAGAADAACVYAACADAARSARGQQQQQQQERHWQREGRGFWADEVAAWGSSAALLQGRVLRQLRVDGDGAGGGMAARLA